MDEKSQIQALDRTQPGLPMKKGRAGTMTHDYKRNGTTTLFAALNVLDGTVIGQCQKRHRHQEFLGFLRKLDRETPKSLDLHLIVDNYATHKHAKVKDAAGKTPPLPFPLHANLGVLAEPGGTVLRRNNQGRHPPRRLKTSPNWRRPSTTSPNTTIQPNPSSGPPPPKTFSKRSIAHGRP